MIIKYVALAFTLLSNIAAAGQPDGPYLAWVPEGPNSSEATGLLSEYLNNQVQKGYFCGNIARGPILVIRALPKGLDSKMVERGVWRGDKAAMSDIQRMLNAYRLTPENESLDGVVAFRSMGGGWSEVASLGVGGPRIRRSKVLTAQLSTGLVGSFCAVIPPILRN
jgi:hypothetical protein